MYSNAAPQFSRMAAQVSAKCPSVCAAERNIASNCEGATYCPQESIFRKYTENAERSQAATSANVCGGFLVKKGESSEPTRLTGTPAARKASSSFSPFCSREG